MLYTKKFSFLSILFCTNLVSHALAQAASEPKQEKKQNSLELMVPHKDAVMCESLKQALNDMIQGSWTPSIENSNHATALLLAAIDEPYHNLEFVTFLINFFKSNKQNFDVREVMHKTLLGQPSKHVVNYLLEEKIYPKRYLSKKRNYNVLVKLDKLHAFYLLFIDSSYIRFFPNFVMRIWHSIIAIHKLMALINYFYENTLCSWVNGKIAKVPFIGSIKGIVITYLLRVVYILYLSIKIGVEPTPIFYLFGGDFTCKDKKEVENLALLLLRCGADAHAKALFIHEQTETEKLLGLPKNLHLYNYIIKSVIHFAAQHDMLDLVKKLIQQGADINAVAVTMQDKLTIFNKANKVKSALPFAFVTIRDLYSNKKGIRQTSLDLAPVGSQTASYLKQHGGKYYQELIDKKVPKLRSNQAK